VQFFGLRPPALRGEEVAILHRDRRTVARPRTLFHSRNSPRCGGAEIQTPYQFVISGCGSPPSRCSTSRPIQGSSTARHAALQHRRRRLQEQQRACSIREAHKPSVSTSPPCWRTEGSRSTKPPRESTRPPPPPESGAPPSAITAARRAAARRRASSRPTARRSRSEPCRRSRGAARAKRRSCSAPEFMRRIGDDCDERRGIPDDGRGCCASLAVPLDTALGHTGGAATAAHRPSVAAGGRRAQRRRPHATRYYAAAPNRIPRARRVIDLDCISPPSGTGRRLRPSGMKSLAFVHAAGSPDPCARPFARTE